MKDVVDLELPSGTLWSRYNLGVDPNQLSNPEDWYGDYYAWAELETNKPEFSWPNYKFGNKYNKLTKYCNNPEYGLNRFTDNLTQLLPEDDAAYQNKNLHTYKFHMPTKDQCEELLKYTNNYWVNNYDPDKIEHNPKDDKGIKGLNGRVFNSKVNGNTLFIPAAGYCNGINGGGSSCYLWSSSLRLDSHSRAYYLSFNSGDINIYYSNRCFGFPIRPVINL